MRLPLLAPFLIAAFAFAILHFLRGGPPPNPTSYSHTSPHTSPTPPTLTHHSSPLSLPMNVAVIGSTGSTGRATVHTLQSTPSISSILAITRRPFFPNPSAPLTEHVVPNLHALAPSDFRNASTVFCCLGTTRAQAGGAEGFKREDRDLILHVARQAKEAGVRSFQLVSSHGANAQSWTLYLQTKGEVEEACKGMGFEQLGIWKPAMLDTTQYPRDRQRLVEKIALGVMGALSPIMGQARPIPVERVAQAMVKDSVSGRKGVRVFDGSKSIDEFLLEATATTATAPQPDK